MLKSPAEKPEAW